MTQQIVNAYLVELENEAVRDCSDLIDDRMQNTLDALEDAIRDRGKSKLPKKLRGYLFTCYPVLLLASGHLPEIKRHQAMRFTSGN